MQASELLNRITKAKRSQTRLLAHVLQKEPVLGEKIKWCGGWLHFREWIQMDETRLLNANFCKKHLLCQACAVRRAAKMNEAYAPKVQSVCEDHPNLIPAMITLTVKNMDDLAAGIQHLKDSWGRMLAAKRKGAAGSERHLPVEWNKVLGSLRALEVTKGKDGLWHPHLHVFTLLSAYINQKALSAEWERFSGDSRIVGVTKCRGGIEAGLREVLKYSCKFSSLTSEETLHVHDVCKGSRLIDPQGVLRGVPEPDIDSDSIEGLTGPYRDFIALWVQGQARYSIKYLPGGAVDPDEVLPSGLTRRSAEFMSKVSCGKKK
jgi:hypothetical protein